MATDERGYALARSFLFEGSCGDGGGVKAGNLAGCGGPEEAVVLLANVAKEFLVVRNGVLITGRPALERHIVGVRGQQCHTAMRDHPIEFFLPDVDALFAKHHKKVEVLRSEEH